MKEGQNPNPENEIVRHRFQAVNQKYAVLIFGKVCLPVFPMDIPNTLALD
jgi:hypothetical protein